MQPTIKELEEKYNKMRDDQILNLLEDEWMREDATAVLKKIAKSRWLEIANSKKVHNLDDKKNNTQEVKWIGWWLYLIGFILFIGVFGNFALLLDQTGFTDTYFFDFISNLTFLALSIYCLILFLGKSKKFPIFFIWFLIFKIVYTIISYLAGWGSWEEVGINIFFGIVLWLYVGESKRVKNTFINGIIEPKYFLKRGIQLVWFFVSLIIFLVISVVWEELGKDLWKKIQSSKQNQIEEIYKQEIYELGFNTGNLREIYWNSDNKNKDFSKEINELKQKIEELKKNLENESTYKEDLLTNFHHQMKLTGDYINLMNRDALISLTKMQNTDKYKLVPSEDFLRIEAQVSGVVFSSAGKDLLEKQKLQLEKSFQSEIDNGKISIKELDIEKVIKVAEDTYKEKMKKDEEFYNLLFK